MRGNSPESSNCVKSRRNRNNTPIKILSGWLIQIRLAETRKEKKGRIKSKHFSTDNRYWQLSNRQLKFKPLMQTLEWSRSRRDAISKKSWKKIRRRKSKRGWKRKWFNDSICKFKRSGCANNLKGSLTKIITEQCNRGCKMKRKRKSWRKSRSWKSAPNLRATYFFKWVRSLNNQAAATHPAVWVAWPLYADALPLRLCPAKNFVWTNNYFRRSVKESVNAWSKWTTASTSDQYLYIKIFYFAYLLKLEKKLMESK